MLSFESTWSVLLLAMVFEFNFCSRKSKNCFALSKIVICRRNRIILISFLNRSKKLKSLFRSKPENDETTIKTFLLKKKSKCEIYKCSNPKLSTKIYSRCSDIHPQSEWKHQNGDGTTLQQKLGKIWPTFWIVLIEVTKVEHILNVQIQIWHLKINLKWHPSWFHSNLVQVSVCPSINHDSSIDRILLL